jgi:hypothetical protein
VREGWSLILYKDHVFLEPVWAEGRETCVGVMAGFFLLSLDILSPLMYSIIGLNNLTEEENASSHMITRQVQLVCMDQKALL